MTNINLFQFSHRTGHAPPSSPWKDGDIMVLIHYNTSRLPSSCSFCVYYMCSIYFRNGKATNFKQIFEPLLHIVIISISLTLCLAVGTHQSLSRCGSLYPCIHGGVMMRLNTPRSLVPSNANALKALTI